MAIRSFTSHHGLFGRHYEWFLAVIREMDAEYLGLRVIRQPDQIESVSMTDHKGLRGLLRRLGKPSAS